MSRDGGQKHTWPHPETRPRSIYSAHWILKPPFFSAAKSELSLRQLLLCTLGQRTWFPQEGAVGRARALGSSLHSLTWTQPSITCGSPDL